MGTQLAGLIFFLNPRLPFAFAPVLRGIAVYGSLLGLVSLVLHLPFTWGRPGRARRALPWSLTVALGASAALHWTHASYYAYFLPPGINERLIKTALWLSLGALIAFYTALLHTLHRRRYGLRSRSAYVLIVALSVYTMVERRDAFRPPPARPPRMATVEQSQRPRLWVVALDAATLDAILPLAGQGRLPFLANVLQGGAYGRLGTISPTRRDAVLTTLATGKYPYKHGIMGRRAYPAEFLAPGAEIRLLPAGISFRRWGTLGRGPLPGSSPRKALALWEILPRLGVPAGVDGWPETEPRTGGEPAAMFLLLPELREVSRRTFGGFNAVQFEGDQENPAARAAAERLAEHYAGIDKLLAEIWAREEGRPRLLAVVSAYGVDPQGGWRRLWGQVTPAAALGGEFLNAPDGALLLYGDGIRPGSLLTDARIIDVAPTLLYGLGFPVARDMDGKVLTTAFTREFLRRNPLTFFPSYEGLAQASPR
ncbi:MAG TPA: alkaline phosphatase family protein [Thermoanaerobaculia bacterium]|nr:alkaline phosphatase family protein [Thermoanaerobaculia bacterium]